MSQPNLCRVKNLTMTCGACPSQWEGWSEDGDFLFVHYRYGILYVEKGGERIFYQEIGDSFDGIMSTDEMLDYTGLELVSDESNEMDG